MFFFSIMPKIVLTFLFVKLYFLLFFFDLKFSYLFFIFGFLSVIIGSFSAIYQFKIKRFLAYSTIVNIGFILISLSFFSFDAMFISIFYMICYITSIYFFFNFLLLFRKQMFIEFYKIFDF